MLRKSYIYLIAASLAFTACEKDERLTGAPDKSVAFVSFTNVNASTKAVNIFADGAKINNVSFISANGSLAGTYAGLQPGSRNIIIRDTLSPGTTTYFNSNIAVNGGNSYAFYLYDVVTGGALKGILLNTDRTPDANSANSKVRFLNLSPGAPQLDFVLVRREATVPKDSIVLYSGIPYLGNVPSPNIAALSAFNSVRSTQLAGLVPATSPASDYIIRIKLANTNTIVSSTAASSLVPGRNYTFFARGIYPATALTSTLNN